MVNRPLIGTSVSHRLLFHRLSSRQMEIIEFGATIGTLMHNQGLSQEWSFSQENQTGVCNWHHTKLHFSSGEATWIVKMLCRRKKPRITEATAAMTRKLIRPSNFRFMNGVVESIQLLKYFFSLGIYLELFQWKLTRLMQRLSRSFALFNFY